MSEVQSPKSWQSRTPVASLRRLNSFAQRIGAFAALMALSIGAVANEILWQPNRAGLAMVRITNDGPVIFTAVRVELSQFEKEFSLITTLASNQIVGTEPLRAQVNALPKDLGTPVAAMNADFFMMTGAAKGDPRGLHVWRGELVSIPSGPAAFWRDSKGQLQGEPVRSLLTVSWPGAGTNRAGLNEQLRTNDMVLFTPRMGPLNSDRNATNAAAFSGRQPRGVANSSIPQGGPIRPPGGREFILEHSGAGPWLPLRVGHVYHAKVAASCDGFTNVPAGKMILMLGSNFLASVESTNLQNSALRTPHSASDLLTPGTPVTITAATDPDLTGVQEALGTGPMLVRDGEPYEVTARMSEQLHPRAALGWNSKYLYFATADGRQKEISIGIKLSDMAEFMIELGCEEAINMDGGQSTTLMLNGQIINQQSSGLHAIANGIVVLRRSAAEQNTED